MGSISIGDTHGNDHANSDTSRVSRLHGDDSRVPRQWGLHRQRDDSGSVIPKEPTLLPHNSRGWSDRLQETFRIIASATGTRTSDIQLKPGSRPVVASSESHEFIIQTDTHKKLKSDLQIAQSARKIKNSSEMAARDIGA